MTISQRHPDANVRVALWFSFIALVISGISIAFINSDSSALKHAIAEKNSLIAKLEAENETFKNSVFAIVDSRQLVDEATKRGYVKDSRPRFLTFAANGAAVPVAQTAALKP